jgi:uncharacterized protein GlcG (DUF336 family)
MADGLKLEQVQAAMKAMMDKAMEKPNEPIAMCIVDATGNLEAYAKMDNLRIFSRRHAHRKAYTAAVMGMDTGLTPSDCTLGAGTSQIWETLC